MNLQTYEKTRYQSIYRHKKNKNYVVMLSNPVKTSISRIDGKKIEKLEDALKIRDNPKIKLQKKNEVLYRETFDTVWEKYVEDCNNAKHLAYNTMLRKEKTYNKYLKGKINKNISKITKEYISNFVEEQTCSLKQKNQIIKELKAFFNWCIEEEYLLISPIEKLRKYKVEKNEMKYWLPEDLKKILDVINNDIENGTNLKIKYNAYIVKMIIIIGFGLGNRIGETRALRFCDINKNDCSITIKHSISYNINDGIYLKTTKTKESNRTIFTTQKVISEIFKYKDFLINEMNFDITDNSLIIINYKTTRPYSDVGLRKMFNYYIEKANVPKIRMYDLRHTTATTLMSEGYDMYAIQDKLRHKSIQTTIDVYGHITLNKRKEIAEITDKYI